MAKPVVDGIERALGDQGKVLRIPLTGAVGRALAAELGVRAVPTLVVYDSEGYEILRQVGALHRGVVLTALELETKP